MLFKSLTAIALASAAGLFLTLEADANSRFTVENQTELKANVYIYSGGDSVCSFEEKLKTASGGETDSYGCTGNGKNRCKVQLYINGSKICKKQMDTCSNDSKKMNNGAKVTISTDRDGKYVCAFE
ncbi:MAG: hypothetical protein ACE37M_07795 [Henriciella sp.]